jgi:CHAD domain-containing protein
MDDSATHPIISVLPSDIPVSTGMPDVVPTKRDTAADRPITADRATAAGEASERAKKQSSRPNEPMIVFAYACLRRELESLVAHKPSPNAAASPEEVHQSRIAMRRMRVALRLFRRMLPHKAKHFRKELRSFARALGDVRDLDVHADNFRAYTQALGAENVAELGGYELHLRRERVEARDRLSAVFGDEGYGTLLASLASFIEDEPRAGALRRWRSFKVSDGVDKYLKKSLKRVRKLGRKVGKEAHSSDLHRLRIRAKRLRYEIEFFAEAYPSLKRAAREAKALQELLGEHQDACAAIERLRAYARALRKHGATPMPPALTRLVASEKEKANVVRERFGAAWSRFERSVAHGRLAA